MISLIMLVKTFQRDLGQYSRTLWELLQFSEANFGQDSTHSTNAIVLFMEDSTLEMDAKLWIFHSCSEERNMSVCVC